MNFVKHQMAAAIIALLWACGSAQAQDLAGGDAADETQTPSSIVADRWAFSFAPYLWMAGLNGTTTGGDSIEMPFSQILEDLNFGVMGVAELERGRFGLFADLIYLRLSETDTATANIVGNPLTFRLKTKVEGVVLTTTAGYRVVDTPTIQTTGFAGMRYLWLDTKLDFTVGGLGAIADRQGHVFDAVAGLKGQVNLTDKWHLAYYGDIGTGQSDLTWQAFAGIGYRLKRFDAIVGYRALDYQFANKASMSDLSLHGPIVGAKFRF